MIKKLLVAITITIPYGRAVLKLDHKSETGTTNEPRLGQISPLSAFRAPGASLATRWIDLLPSTKDNGEDENSLGGGQLRTALGLRQSSALSSEVGTKVASSPVINTKKTQFLWCFLGRDEAGLITQQRHLVECSLLARRLQRIMLTPPLLVSGMDPKIWPRFWDELVNTTVLGDSVKADIRSGRTAKALSLNDTAIIDLHYSVDNCVPRWVVDFFKKHLGFRGRTRSDGEPRNSRKHRTRTEAADAFRSFHSRRRSLAGGWHDSRSAAFDEPCGE
jgi:hypothetical protein